MVLNSDKTEKVKLPSQSFVTNTTYKFLFENLLFHSKRKASFILPNYSVEIDTTIYIPSIYIQNSPINWHEIQSPKAQVDLATRLEELSEIEQKNIIDNSSIIQIDSIKTDENAIDGISPSLVIPQKVITPNLDSFIYSNLIEPNIQKHQRIFVFIEDQLVTNTEFKKLNKIVKMAYLDKILIFEEVIPAQYNVADYAIVLILKDKSNSTYLVQGFDN
jgi:hypothetical protein